MICERCRLRASAFAASGSVAPGSVAPGSVAPASAPAQTPATEAGSGHQEGDRHDAQPGHDPSSPGDGKPGPTDQAPGRSSLHGDDGRAVIEFVFLAVLILVPLIYLVLVAGRLQAATFAAAHASREAGRVFVTSGSDDQAGAQARAASAMTFEDFGFTEGTSVQISCSAAPCLSPDGEVTTTAVVVVDLPLVPDFLREAVPHSVTLRSSTVSSVDRFVSR